MQALEAAFESERPNVVMVQGDTLSTLCGAMAAFYQRIPVAHVEAGLRSGSLMAPFPEEANRKMVTQLATWHFTPTAATTALTNEGYSGAPMGNTVIDAASGADQGHLGTRGTQHHLAAHDVGDHSPARKLGDGLRNVVGENPVADHHGCGG